MVFYEICMTNIHVRKPIKFIIGEIKYIYYQSKPRMFFAITGNARNYDILCSHYIVCILIRPLLILTTIEINDSYMHVNIFKY